MSVFELFRIAFTSISGNILRSILTMLGVTIGVAAVITMVSVASGARQEIDEQMKSLGSTLFMVYSGSRSFRGVSSASGNWAVLTDQDAHALREEIPEIVAAAANLRGSAQIVSGNQNWNCSIYAVDQDYLVARNWQIRDGNEISPTEFNRGSKVVLLGNTVREALFGEGNAVGQTIRVNNVPLEVVGTLEKKGVSGGGRDIDDMILIPLKAGRERILGRRGSSGNAVDGIWVTVEHEWQMPDVEELIKDVLSTRHRIGPNQNEPFTVRNMSEMVESSLESRNTLNYLLSAVASISLVVGGIGIMNIMLVTVTERTREIGLRMAVGATGSIILRQFLVEAVVLCGLGGVAGILISFIAGWVIATTTGFPMVFEWYVFVVSVVFSAGIGVFFGFYPAQQAAAKDPIEALRSE